MTHWKTEAINKLEEGKKNVSGQKEKAMAQEVMDQLKDFCRQDEEFAQAVAQGSSFSECMKKLAQGVRDSISDLEAYKRAVQFYFPGAEVRMQLTIDRIGKAAGKGDNTVAEKPAVEEKSKIISLTLFDFFE